MKAMMKVMANGKNSKAVIANNSNIFIKKD